MEKEYLIRQTLKMVGFLCSKLIHPDFKVSGGGEPIRIISKALERLEKKCGALSRTRIADYVITALLPFKDRGLDWKLNQAFGPKSLERYSTDKGLKYYEDRWLASENLTRASVAAIVADRSEHPKARFVYMPSEERTKQRLHNSEAGFFICQTSTLGWSPESESCLTCSFTERCKAETQRKYPEIYRLRIENGQQR